MIAGWTASDALFAFPGGGGGSGASQTTEYPLGYVGPEFAGRTLDIQLYDEGDLQGTNSSNKGSTIYAVSPYVSGYTGDPCLVSKTNLTGAGYASSNFIFPYNERTAQFTKQSPLIGIEGSLNGDIIYNGLWADEQVVVPSNYTGGNWTICAIAPQTNDSDVVGIRVEALGESPVHLVGA